MEDTKAVENKICDLLGLGSGVLAVSVIQVALPTFSEAEICQALVSLCEAEIVAIDREGVHLLGDKEVQTAEPSRPVVEQPTSPTSPIGDAEELLGSSVEPDYSDTYLPDDEIDAMLAQMGYTVTNRSDVDEREAFDAIAETEWLGTDSGEVDDVGEAFLGASDPLVFDSPVKRLGFKTRAANYFERSGIRLVGELVRALPSLDKVNGLGAGSVEEVRSKAESAALPLSIPVTREQLGALCELSGSQQLVFDLFGVLCIAEADNAVDAFAAQETALQLSDSLSVRALDMPEPTIRCLWASGVRTVGDIRALGDERLLRLHAFGPKKLEDVKAALSGKTKKSIDPVEPAEFFAQFPDTAHAIIDRLCEVLSEEGLPVLRDSLKVMLIPRAQRLLEENARGEDAVETVVAQLADAVRLDEHAAVACACDLRRRMRKLLKHARKGKLDAGFAVPDTAAWNAAAEQMCAQRPDLVFDTGTRLLSVKAPTVAEWAHTLKDSHARALALRLQGKTLEEVGNELGLTRERIRQITTKVLGKRPALSEDKYRRLFDGYQMTKEQFCAITGEPGEVYEYLDLTKEKGLLRGSLEEAMDDEVLDDGIKANIRDVLDEGFAYVDGERVLLRRKPVIEMLLRKHAKDEPISLDELLELYRFFTDEHGMDDPEVFEGTGPRAMSANLDRWKFSLRAASPKGENGVRRDIRYYDWEALDFGPLRAAVEAFAARHGGIECSAALLMRDADVRAAAEEVGLRNEYELHCVMSRVMAEDDFLALGKRPMVQFGEADRGRQVLDLIRELGPIEGRQLAAAYEERYGVAEATFRGSFLKDFAAYETDGIYAVPDVELTIPQRDFLSAVLRGRNYVALDEVRRQFETAFPDASPQALNAQNLEPMGYVLVGGLVARQDADLASVFGGILDSREVLGIDDADLGIAVMRNEVFKSELNKRIRAFQLVEYKPDHFVRTSAFARMGSTITADDLREFMEAAIEFMEPGRPYSVKSLRAAGFAHPVFGLKDLTYVAGDFFFGSIIGVGYVGGRIKKTSLNDTQFFSRKNGQLSAPDVIAWEVERMDSPTEDDLIARLREEHDVEIERPLLRALLKRAGIQLKSAINADAADAEAPSEPLDAPEIDFFADEI